MLVSLVQEMDNGNASILFFFAVVQLEFQRICFAVSQLEFQHPTVVRLLNSTPDGLRCCVKTFGPNEQTSDDKGPLTGS